MVVVIWTYGTTSDNPCITIEVDRASKVLELRDDFLTDEVIEIFSLLIYIMTTFVILRQNSQFETFAILVHQLF